MVEKRQGKEGRFNLEGSSSSCLRSFRLVHVVQGQQAKRPKGFGVPQTACAGSAVSETHKIGQWKNGIGPKAMIIHP